MPAKKAILIILDGWGLGKNKEVSAIEQANIPFFRAISKNYANTTLEASGLAVGLPEGQMGNSEVGHMNLGAGRVVYQDLVKINLACQEHTLGQEAAIQELIAFVKENGKALHLIGLVSDGGIHAHITHAKELLSVFAEAGLTNIKVHAITDGRDADPKSGKGFVEDLLNHMSQTTGQLASVIGRYYAMDRDNRWERVAKAYNLLIKGQAEVKTNDALAAIEASYQAGVTDEFILPIALVDAEGNSLGNIAEGDAVLMFNFRTDRGRELTQALTQKAFPEQGMKPLALKYVTMTNYDDTFQNVDVVYDKDNLNLTMGEVLTKAGRTQIRIAETEKYPHVTFFFSGGREEPFEGEQRLLCPSPKVATYDLQPEMSAWDITNAIVPELKKGEVDFVCLNFANTDMVGHTGVWEAAVKAAETVDQCLAEVVGAALANGYASFVIADHGNSDVMINPDGSPNTQHTTNLVPLVVVDPAFAFPTSYRLQAGKLGDVAPTILSWMDVTLPEEMTGTVLFEKN